MTPDQSTEIGGHKIEEFYWAGRMVVYVDNQAVADSYGETCRKVRSGERPSFERAETQWTL